MTAQPEHPPLPKVPTPEEMDAFERRRFADPGELLEAWFALFGTTVTSLGQAGAIRRGGAVG